MQLKTGIVFDGNPDELVFASPKTIYDVIPDEAVDWKRVFDQLYGFSQPGKYWRKGDLFDYVLNVYARFFLPQYTYVGTTIYEAAHWFFLLDDLKPENKAQQDDVLGFWTVTAQALYAKATTNEADPCFQRFESESASYSYFGYTPHPHKAVPYPTPCKQQFEVNETAQGGPKYNPYNNNGFFASRSPTESTTWHKAGGWSAELMTIEVTEAGQLYVGLPQLPEGVNNPPPLIGRVVDFGPPGPPGLPGPPGPPGADGSMPTGDDFVGAFCSLSPTQKDDFSSCMHFPPFPTYGELVFAATPLEVETAQQILIEKAPDVMIPTGEVVLTESGEATMEATALANGRIHWVLALPLLLLIGAKMLSQKIRVRQCVDKTTPLVVEIPFPAWTFESQSQVLVFQELFDQIWQLQQCCTPCESEDWELIASVKGPYKNLGLKNYDAILLKLIDEVGPEIDTWYRSGTIFKLGEMRWAFHDGIEFHFPNNEPRYGPLLYWNSINQVFYAPNGLTIGMSLDCEYIKTYEVWARPRKDLPSLTQVGQP